MNYLVNLATEGQTDRLKDYPADYICLTARGRQIKSKTHGQMKYVNAIRNNTVVFGIGPAGTGKTFLAVAMAVTAFGRSRSTGSYLPVRQLKQARSWAFTRRHAE